MSTQYQLVRKTIASLGGIINHKKTKLVTTLADHKAHEFIEQERLPEDCLAPSLKYLGVHIRPPYTNRCWGTHIRMRVAKAWAAYHLLTQKGMPRDGRFVQIGLEILYTNAWFSLSFSTGRKCMTLARATARS
jgi:hypothetical protein